LARVTVEDCLDHCPDQFALVRLASLRTRQLQRGARKLVECKNKEIVSALREIATGKVTFRENVAETVMRVQKQPTVQRLDDLGSLDDDFGTSLI
jgi:DNA-directed RNA polymerase subunit omega